MKSVIDQVFCWGVHQTIFVIEIKLPQTWPEKVAQRMIMKALVASPVSCFIWKFKTYQKFAQRSIKSHDLMIDWGGGPSSREAFVDWLSTKWIHQVPFQPLHFSPCPLNSTPCRLRSPNFTPFSHSPNLSIQIGNKGISPNFFLCHFTTDSLTIDKKTEFWENFERILRAIP